jgi:maleylacetoacetate isomerase
MSCLIACDVHPVNNLRVLRYLQQELKVTPGQKDTWYRHWVAGGMTGVERLLARAASEAAASGNTGPWCFGAHPTLADVCLVPQFANALRMGCDMSAYTRSLAIYEYANAHPAFDQTRPQKQPDYVAA